MEHLLDELTSILLFQQQRKIDELQRQLAERDKEFQSRVRLFFSLLNYLIIIFLKGSA